MACCIATVLPCLTAAGEHNAGPHLSAAIRYTPDGWAAVQDESHTPHGVGQIDTLADRVRVFYTHPIASVGSLQATVDEQFAAAGVRVGASVGLNHADLFFYMGTNQNSVNPALLTRAGANVWLTGWAGQNS